MITALIILGFLLSAIVIGDIIFMVILWLIYRCNGGKHGLIWYIVNWR